MFASLSNNSFKQYDCYLKRWFDYCYTNNIDLYEASIPKVIGFLMKMFDEGAQYGTLNSCRSALGLILNNLNNNDDRIKRFLKGVYRLRPPLPRYNITWDTSIVLDFLGNWYPNDDMSLEVLSKKLITLLALSTAHRAQTFSKIQIENIEIYSDKVIIKIPDLIKTSRMGALQPILILPIFMDRLEVCPAKCLIAYLDKTRTIRNNINGLFISFRKPYKLVTTQTLSRWIKDVLYQSGIDVSIFSAHSTRHAAVSAAHRLGVSLDTIRKTAGWSGSSSTFFKYYNRPVINQNNQTNDSFSCS